MITKEIEQLTIIELNELFYTNQLNESQFLELKREVSLDKNGKPESKEFAKDVVSFANSKGGYIIIGVDEKAREICGTEALVASQKIEDWISNVLNDLVDKTISYKIELIPLDDEVKKHVIVIQIAEGIDKPYYVIADKKSIPYIRKGTSIFAAKPSDIKEMYEARMSRSNNNDSIKIDQKANGKNIQQVAINNGQIINTAKHVTKTEVIYDPMLHITDSEAKAILDKVNEIVDIHDKAGRFKTSQEKSIFYRKTWTDLKNKFKYTKYTLIPKSKYEDVLQWLQYKIVTQHRPILRKNNNEEWRKQNYTSIYTIAKKVGLEEKVDLYRFAFEKLALKTPIKSLKDLNDTQLKKLTQFLYNK